jgi:predicted O-methyltransferase YrrM
MNRNDESFARVLHLYEERLNEERATMESLSRPEFSSRVDEFLLPVGRDVAELLRDLAIGLGAQTIVEVGTSYGYSTLFLADAARRTGGKLYTYDLVASKQAYARERLAEANLAEFVEWRSGDAMELLRDQPGPVDLVLMDLWKDLYVSCFELIYPSLAPGGVIVADNMLHPESARPNAEAYRKAVRAKPDIEAILLPIGHGIDIGTRRLAGG